MEIISPSSVIRDFNLKKELCGRHACREYWIWDARLQWVTRFVRLASGAWDEGTSWGPRETAASTVLTGFSLSMVELRAELGIKD